MRTTCKIIIVPSGHKYMVVDEKARVWKLPKRIFRRRFGNVKKVELIYYDGRKAIVKIGKRIEVRPFYELFFDPVKLTEVVRR